MTSSVWIVVPMRGIELGKSRLAAVLDDADRMRLNRWLLDHTLSVIASWRGDLRHCVVVSPCLQALEVAQRAGAVALPETPERSGLNQALVLGATHAVSAGAEKLLIVPSDLPELTAAALRAFAAEGTQRQHMVLAPDTARAGTNALLVDAHPDPGFSFGADSFGRHQAVAAARGWTVSICARAELAFDLDTPRDLAAWPAFSQFRRDAGIARPLQSGSSRVT